MAEHDLGANGMENSVPILCSPKDRDLSIKAMNLCDHSEISTDIVFEIQKSGHETNGITNGPNAANLPGTNGSDHISSDGCPGENLNKGPPSAISKSRNLEAEQEKEGEVSMHSHERISVLETFSFKSDVIPESLDSTQALDNDSNQLVDPVSDRGNGMKFVTHTAYHDMQHKTESSSSNSTLIILPASSNESCQETSVDVKLCNHRKTSTPNASSCADCNSNFKEPGGRSSEIVVSDRGLDNDNLSCLVSDSNFVTVLNSNPKCTPTKSTNTEFPDYDKGKPLELDDDLDLTQKPAREVKPDVVAYKEASGSSSSVKERNKLHLRSLNSEKSYKNGCSTENGGKIELCNEQDKYKSLCSSEEEVDLEKPTRNQEIISSEVREFLQVLSRNMVHETGLHALNSSFSTVEDENVVSGDRTICFPKIDLNEDISTDEVECHQHLFRQSLSCHMKNLSKPIPLLAKSGIPVCLPMLKKQCKGDRDGWRGSSATSAFQPINLYQSRGRNGRAFNKIIHNSKHSHIGGIDLNIVATDTDIDLNPEKSFPAHLSFLSEESSVEVSSTSTKATILDIDLNFVTKDDDICQASALASSSRHSARDFDLNANPTATPTTRLSSDARELFPNRARPTNSADWTSMQAVSHKPFILTEPNMLSPNAQMHRVTSLQPKLTYTPPPSHAFIYNTGFCINANNSLTTNIHSSNVIPFITDPLGVTVIPHVLGSTAISSFPVAGHPFELPYGADPTDFSFIRPSLDPKSASIRPSFAPINTSTMEEHSKSSQQVSLSVTPMKRRQPEGGLDSRQSPYRQVTSWR